MNVLQTPSFIKDKHMADKYMVAYAKIVLDKDEGIVLAGVFFGGIEDTLAAAELAAKECVNTIRGGTILPKVIKLGEDCKVIDALYDAADKFERVTTNMIESDKIISRGRRK